MLSLPAPSARTVYLSSASHTQLPQRSRPFRFVDLFAGLGGFHAALSAEGHECVFASELDEELRRLYIANHRMDPSLVAGDISESWKQTPRHDVLCAGFPCQPFSKSGAQRGRSDVTRGTLFDHVLEIARTRKPRLILLENVGNFARHDDGRTWNVIRTSLESLGYSVRGTDHKADGGHGLISPHHFGHPHHRERFFVIAARWQLPTDPFPRSKGGPTADSLRALLDHPDELTAADRAETALSAQQVACIELWNALLKRIQADVPLPSFPIWGDEIGAKYPYVRKTPWELPRGRLRSVVTDADDGARYTHSQLLQLLPSYARVPGPFPLWKQRFIRRNRDWFSSLNGALTEHWTKKLRALPPSLRKLEWNCQGEDRDLWTTILQFRPSGLRAKRFDAIPALVAMTTTQIPILGPQRRYITRREGLRLQGLSPDLKLPVRRQAAFRALGNAVHVDVIRRIFREAVSTAP